MILFVCNIHPNDLSRGITKKCFAQMRACNNLGYQVDYYTAYIDDGVCIYNSKDEIVKKLPYKTKNRYINRVFRNQYLKKCVFDFLSEKPEEVKVLYSRFLFFDRITYKLFKKAKESNMKTILELHSYPCYFAKEVYMYPVYAVDFAYRRRTLQYVDRIAAMTDKKNIWNIETVHFENGINLESIQPQRRTREPGIIRIIAVSYEWKVHGYDRMIKGLYNYYHNQTNKYDVELVLVGTVMKSTQQLVKKMGLQKHVTMVGIKQGAELDKVYDECDIGMGCLGLHRRAQSAVSDLKTREYAAKGIPYIYAGNQLGEDLSFKYALKLPSDETPIDVNRIVEFYESFATDENVGQNMREWAKNYTWETQMEKVLKFEN